MHTGLEWSLQLGEQVSAEPASQYSCAVPIVACRHDFVDSLLNCEAEGTSGRRAPVKVTSLLLDLVSQMTA